MIYRFEDPNSKNLEVEQTYKDEATITIKNHPMDVGVSFTLNKTQIYDLIGSLHSIQTKIKNFKED